MKLVQKLLSALGGIFLAALLMAALAPRATRAVAAALVQVVNTPSNPVATAESLGTATILEFQCIVSADVPGGGNFASGPCFTVPHGKRAVVENIDGVCFSPSGSTVGGAGLIVFSPTTLIQVDHQIPLHFAGVGGAANNVGYDYNLPVRFYADPGDTFSMAFATSDTLQASACIANISGRLVPTS